MTKIINLDSLASEPLVAITIGGKRHEMRTATVNTFIENMKAIESLGLNASPVKEVEVIVGIVARSFPTLTEDEIRNWPLDMIQKLSEIARGAGGEFVTNDADKAKEADKTGNVQSAS